MVYHTKSTMPVKAITNNTYESSISYINRGIPPNPGSNSSLERFYRAANMISDYNPDSSGNVIEYAFKVLDSVKQGTWTKFQTVFDIKNRVIYFKSLQNQKQRFFYFNKFDFSCNSISRILDINSYLSGNVTDNFSDYTREANENLINTAWEELGYSDIYQPALEIISCYPETFVCKEITGSYEIKNQFHGKIETIKNYPNPFNPSTTIEYSVNRATNIKLSIFNSPGRRIKILCNLYQKPGKYSVNWDGTDQSNTKVPSGIYFIDLEMGNQNLSRKMVLIR